VSTLPVPRFQELKTLRGDWRTLAREIGELKARESRAWLEVVYEGSEIASSLRAKLDEAVAGTAMEILRVKNTRVMERALGGENREESLDDLDVTDVFKRCLDAHEIPREQRLVLMEAYNEILVSLHEADPQAE